MSKFGEVLGWATAICYFISVANFLVKRIFKAWIAKMPKGNTFRKSYQFFMKLLVKYHRYFGMGAGAFAVLHLCWQIINVRVSYSGILAAVLMSVTAILGIFIAYGKKSSLTKVHRPMAIAIMAVIIFHMITKL
jgi:hypothetical protein